MGVDVETGRRSFVPMRTQDHSARDDHAGAIGAHNWSPMSFNPRTGLKYIPSSMGTSTTYTYNPDSEYREGARNKGYRPRRPGARHWAAILSHRRRRISLIVPPSIGPVREVGRGGVSSRGIRLRSRSGGTSRAAAV